MQYTQQAVPVPRALAIVWNVTWGITFLIYAGWAIYYIVQTWPHKDLVDLILAGIVTVMVALGFKDLAGRRELDKLAVWWHSCTVSKHPHWARLGVILLGNVMNLVLPVATALWLVTRSATLAAIAAGVGLLGKLFLSLVLWAWGSIMNNLPAMGFAYGVQWFAGKRTRRNKDGQEKS